MSNSTTRAKTTKTAAPQIDPTADAVTLADTLSYALQSDADPRQVLKELVQVFTPYFRSRVTMGYLRPLLCGAAGRFHDDVFVSVDKYVQATLKLESAADCCTSMNAFVDLAEREIREKNTTDFDNIETLLNGAKAELFRFGQLIAAQEGGAA